MFEGARTGSSKLSNRTVALLGTAGAVAFFSAWYFGRVPSELPAHTDLVDLLAVAKDCAEDRGCKVRLGRGAPHGAGFPHFLAVVLHLGGDTRLAHLMSGGLIALSFGLAFFTVALTLGRAVAFVFLWFAAVTLTRNLFATVPSPDLFWNPTFLGPFSLLFLAAACCHVASPRLGLLALAALCAGMLPNFHQAALMLMPALLGLVWMTPAHRRPAAAALSALLVLACAQLSYAGVWLRTDTLEAFLGGYRTTEFAALLPRLTVGVLLLVGALFALRAASSRRERAVTIFLLTTHLGPFLLLAASSTQARYFGALGPGVTLLAAVVVTRLVLSWRSRERGAGRAGRRVSRKLAVAVAALALAAPLWSLVEIDRETLGLPARVRPPVLTLADLDAVADGLKIEGGSFDHLLRRLHGNELFLVTQLRDALAAYSRRLTPYPSGSAASTEHDLELLVMPNSRVPRPLPEGWTVAREREDESAIIRSFEPVIVWDEYTHCDFFSLADEERCECEQVRHRPTYHRHPRDRRTRSSRVAATISEVRRPEGVTAAVFRIPFRAPEDEETHLVIPNSLVSPCPGAILEVEGVELDETLPAERVTISPGSRGHVIAAWDLETASCVSADTPLPIPTIVERDPSSLLLSVSGPTGTLLDPSLTSAMLRCARGEDASRMREIELPTEPPRPVLPLWYVWALFALFGPAYTLGACYCVRVARRV